MRGIEIFQKPSYREISPMRDRPMRGPPVHDSLNNFSTCCMIMSTIIDLANDIIFILLNQYKNKIDKIIPKPDIYLLIHKTNVLLEI